VPPGITGWAQVHGHRGETDTLEKMQRRVDLAYIAHRSLRFDLRILLLTVRTHLARWQCVLAHPRVAISLRRVSKILK
jgi:lipopolysaccharide/colanic/teichoic acid biosynthesis glycosyltransferase